VKNHIQQNPQGWGTRGGKKRSN